MTLGSFKRERVDGLSRARFANLRTLAWLETGHNLLITGGAGLGKRHLAGALAVEAVRCGWRARYLRVPDLLDQIDTHRRAGTLDLLLKRHSAPSLLVLDGLAEEPTVAEHTYWLRRLIERRGDAHSTLVVSRRAPTQWMNQLDGEAHAAGLHGRLTHRAHQVRLTRARLKP
jgi:DNA replication protein DnaC